MTLANFQPMRPEFDVTLAYNPESVLVPVARVEGLGFTVLGASAGKDGPGPLVSRLLRDVAGLPLPITLIPGDMSRDRLEAIS